MGKVSDAIPSDSNRKHVGHFSIWPTSWPLFIFQLCIRSFNLQSFKHFVLLSKRSTDFQVPSKRNDIRLLTQWWHSNFSFVISSYFPRASTSFHWFQQLTTFLLRVRDCSSLENCFSKSLVFFNKVISNSALYRRLSSAVSMRQRRSVDFLYIRLRNKVVTGSTPIRGSQKPPRSYIVLLATRKEKNRNAFNYTFPSPLSPPTRDASSRRTSLLSAWIRRTAKD